MTRFDDAVRAAVGGHLRAASIDTIQVNVGLRCNQACRHCHLEASPERTERMDWPVMEAVLAAVRRSGCGLVDITGGAPELNPHLPRFIGALREVGCAVQVRTNLTAWSAEGTGWLPEFFAQHGVWLVASLPCYQEENVRAQRGEGVYRRSVEAIRRLNSLGYGRRPDLPLNLVYNPGGPFLPPEQASLEADYRRELGNRFGIVFTRLLTITNMPLGRFQAALRSRGREQEYLQLLERSFNPRTVPSLMCRRQVCVAWDGTLYDCDFNLALGWPLDHGAPDRIERFDPEAVMRRRVVTGEHCFGCTAGAGSSCGGALV